MRLKAGLDILWFDLIPSASDTEIPELTGIVMKVARTGIQIYRDIAINKE
jgi:hypothetical protein